MSVIRFTHKGRRMAVNPTQVLSVEEVGGGCCNIIFAGTYVCVDQSFDEVYAALNRVPEQDTPANG